MSDPKTFIFHTTTGGWRVEVYDISNRLIEACKAKDGNDARILAEAYRARFARSAIDSGGVSPPSTGEHV